MQAINLEASIEKTKSEIPILGRTGKGNKTTGWKGAGRDLPLQYQHLQGAVVPIQGDRTGCVF